MQDTCPETSNTAVITLTESDVKQAYWLIQRKATLTPVGLLKVFFLTILTAIATGINYLQGVAVTWTPTLIFALLFPAVLVALAARQNARAATRTFAQQKSLQRPFALSWTTQGFSTRSEHVDASLPWSDLTQMLHNDKVILLCESDSRFQAVPRRCLTPAQQADLLRLAQAGRTRTPAAPAA